MIRRLHLVFAGLFIVAAAGYIVWFNESRPRVLVLQSYDTSYSWTRDVDVGLRRVLEKQHYAVRWHYMDTKRNPGRESMVSAGKAARRVIDSWKPRVIIAVDDDAQQFVARHYVDRADVKIVFAGVNGGIEPYGYDKAVNVTGILERKPLQGVKEVILTLASTRGELRVFNLGDNSTSVKLDEASIRRHDWAPLSLVESRLVSNFDEWREAIAEANGRADYLITTNYRHLARSAADQTLMPPEEVVKWTEENCKLPVIGTNGFYVEDGGTLAIATSPYEQGEVAARMAVQIMEGQPPGQIKVESTKQFLVYMRAQGMKIKRMTLPGVYEANARATSNYYP